jgi:prepilin-type processing-associated H-X9-DG protein
VVNDELPAGIWVIPRAGRYSAFITHHSALPNPFPPNWEEATIKLRANMPTEVTAGALGVAMAEEKGTDHESHMLPRRRKAPFVEILFVVFVIAGAVVLLMPSVGSQVPWRRVRCNQNLISIGLAIHNYCTKYGSYPPAYTVDRQGRRMHSWRLLLLEFLDADLYSKYDLREPWNSPANLAVVSQIKKNDPYRCPTEDAGDPLWTSYVMLVGPRAFSAGPTGRKPQEIADGASNTVMVVEMSPSGIPWSAPHDLDAEEMSFTINDRDRVGPRSCHPGGANFVLADASVRFFSTQCCNEDTLKALTTINGGEAVNPPD